jgi:hypothetical protein
VLSAHPSSNTQPGPCSLSCARPIAFRPIFVVAFLLVLHGLERCSLPLSVAPAQQHLPLRIPNPHPPPNQPTLLGFTREAAFVDLNNQILSLQLRIVCLGNLPPPCLEVEGSSVLAVMQTADLRGRSTHYKVGFLRKWHWSLASVI